MPFVMQVRIDYLPIIQDVTEMKERRLVMNWIFEAYSNVYNAAMMQDQSRQNHAATAKNGSEPKSFTLFKPFVRG